MKNNFQDTVPAHDYRRQRIEALSDDELQRDEILRRRLDDPTVKKQFRNAYVFKVGVDYATLYPYCENIIMATEGYADYIDITRAKIELALKDYDSDKDVLVSIGRSIDNLLVGMVVVQKVLQKPISRQSYALAVYYHLSYRFYEVFLDPTIEAQIIYTK